MRSAIPPCTKVLVSISILLFMTMPGVSAQIEIVDIGTGYDLIDHYGFVDYRNIGNHNISCALLVFIDDELVATELRDMPIRYVAGFRCSPVKTLEFPLRTSEGNHTIVTYALAQNFSLERMYGYYADDWWVEGDEIEEDKVEEVEDWLPYPCAESSHNYPFWVILVPKSVGELHNCTRKEGVKNKNE